MIKTWNIGSLLLGRPPGWCYVSSREGLSGKTPLKLDFLPAQAGFPWNKSTSNHFFFKKKTRLVKPIIPTGHPTIRAKFHKITLEGRSSITFLPPCLGPSVTPVCFPGSEVFRPKKKTQKNPIFPARPKKICSPRVEKILQPLQKRTSGRFPPLCWWWNHWSVFHGLSPLQNGWKSMGFTGVTWAL